VLLSSLGTSGCALDKAIRRASRTSRATGRSSTSSPPAIKTGGTTPFGHLPHQGQAQADDQVRGPAPGDVRVSGADIGDGAGVDLIANSSGEYSCSPPAAGGRWSWPEAGRASAAVRNQISTSTAGALVAFLKGFSLAAGFAGTRSGRPG